jgi:hypothetical protein
MSEPVVDPVVPVEEPVVDPVVPVEEPVVDPVEVPVVLVEEPSIPAIMPDYFVNARVIESFAKFNKPSEEVKSKLLYLAFQLESDSTGVENYAIHFLNLNPENFVKLIKISSFGDDLTAKDLENLSAVSLKDFVPTLVDTDKMILPYSTDFKSLRRTYRLVLDITNFDGLDGRPDYRDVWGNFPLTIVTMMKDTNIESQKLKIDFTISDCDAILTELSNLVSELGDDLPLADKTFIQNIITNCSCGDHIEEDDCDFVGEDVGTFEIPTLENESILFELTNMDSLICYLKGKLISYKTDIATQTGSDSCYKFLPCLIKAYVGLNRLYRKSVSSHKALLLSAQYMADRYNALAKDHRRGIEAIKGVVKSNSDWIRTNIDANFDISNVKCSNVVESNGEVSYTFKERYTSMYDAVTKSYNLQA